MFAANGRDRNARGSRERSSEKRSPMKSGLRRAISAVSRV
jgi:hypothetical protein